MEYHQKTPENRVVCDVKQWNKNSQKNGKPLHIIAKMATWAQGKWLYYDKTDFMVKLFALDNLEGTESNVFSTIKTDDNIRF